MAYNVSDTKVTSIEFLSGGVLPEGHTLNSLKALSGEDNKYSVDVSKDQNDSIIAYYDSTTGKVYIYSEDLITFNADSSFMFNYFSSLTDITFGKIDTSRATDMHQMFYECRKLTSLDVSKFNTSSVKNMSLMFYRCSGLTSLDLSTFKTGSVTTMSSMFRECSSLIDLDVSSFDTSNVTSMSHMFRDTKLTNLDLSSFNIKNVTSMQYMFSQSYSLKSITVNKDKWVIGENVDTTNISLPTIIYADSQ